MKNKRILPVLLFSIISYFAHSQSYPLEIEQFDKKLNLRIANPNISVHFPTGLIYEDNDGDSFTNLNDHFLRIADGPFGFQIQTENVVYSQLTKNAFSINHYDTPWDNTFLVGPSQRAYWGPRNPGQTFPLQYDLKTFGNIFNVDIANRKLVELRDNAGTGAVRLYRYSNGFIYHHTLTINAAGNPVWLHVSDRRMKENIVNTKKVLPRLLGLQLKKYNYIGNENETTGFIAQDVQKAFPDLVAEMDDGKLGVNYLGFSPLAIQAITEQQEIIESLEERIAKLEGMVNELVK